MSASRTDRSARNEQPRARNVGLLERRLHAPVRAARVAHRGEAAVEHREHQPSGARRHQGQRHGFEVADIHLAQHHVDMTVDQAGHQRPPAAVDHIGARRLDRLVGGLLDGLAFDQQLVPALKLPDFRLEQLEIPKQKLRHLYPPQRDHRTTSCGPAQAICTPRSIRSRIASSRGRYSWSGAACYQRRLRVPATPE